jgi:uncharacterized protein YbjT (DUF2867 family)
MKYVITGGAGHISKPLALSLLKQGHDVTVIGRSEANLSTLVEAGAKPAIGSVDDLSFLTATFAGADAVYTMVPPNFGATNWKAYIASVGELYAKAITANQIKYVVNLSSVGAELPEGCGPVTGLYHVEQALNALSDTHVLHLRPSYFYYNLLANIPLVKGMGIIGSNFSLAEGKFPIVDTTDIASVAFSALNALSFTGHTAQYIASDIVSTDQIASVLGAAIGKPDLKWVPFTNEQALQGMLQAGLPAEIANNYVEMGNAMNSGKMLEGFLNHPPVLGQVKLSDFAKQFAATYQQA